MAQRGELQGRKQRDPPRTMIEQGTAEYWIGGALEYLECWNLLELWSRHSCPGETRSW